MNIKVIGYLIFVLVNKKLSIFNVDKKKLSTDTYHTIIFYPQIQFNFKYFKKYLQYI